MEDLKKTMKNLRIISVVTEIRTRYFLNVIMKYCRWNRVLVAALVTWVCFVPQERREDSSLVYAIRPGANKQTQPCDCLMAESLGRLHKDFFFFNRQTSVTEFPEQHTLRFYLCQHKKSPIRRSAP
jgi:hypothetical protein